MNLNEKRIIVTAWYPGCPWEVGEILNLTNCLIRKDSKPGTEYEAPVYRKGNDVILATEAEKATANFKQLDWWECRDASLNPKYAKSIYNEDCIIEISDIDFKRGYRGSPDGKWYLCHFTPATLADYEQFKKNEQ